MSEICKIEKPFEYAEHTADVMIVAYGCTLEEAFANAAYGFANFIYDTSKVEPKQRVEIEVTGVDLEQLLFNWIDELLYRLDGENFAFNKIEELSPYYIQLFYKELRELALQTDQQMNKALVNQVYKERLLGATGQRALSHYQERLDQALSKDEAKAARDILDLASERAQGISEAKLYDRMDDELSTPADMIDPLLRILLHDGYLKRDGQRFRFRSPLLRDWWRGERAAVRHARNRWRRRNGDPHKSE
jgi:SHS2 domain-containing protein